MDFLDYNGLSRFKNSIFSKTFGPATSSAAGSTGVVPAPAAGDEEKFLKADGTWSKELPYVTSTDDGKFLVVVEGGWAAQSFQAATGVDIEGLRPAAGEYF